jgi:hypothetical protein
MFSYCGKQAPQIHNDYLAIWSFVSQIVNIGFFGEIGTKSIHEPRYSDR